MEEFITLTSRIGSDTYQKLIILLKENYETLGNRLPKSGQPIDLTISLCIELAFNAIPHTESEVQLPEQITPPITKKAQRLYEIYQMVMTLKSIGKTPQSIINYMNSHQHPTADNLFEKKALKYMKPTNWKREDLDYILNTNELNLQIKLLNKRRQRSPKISSNN